jgi:succinoglycan biosynthesis transport protein ExoP
MPPKALHSLSKQSHPRVPVRDPGMYSSVPPRTPGSYYVAVIRRYGWRMLAGIVLVMAATFGVSRLIVPTFEATATVDLDLRMPAGLLGSESRQVSSLDGDQFMATQIKLIQSDSVLRAVAHKYRLLELEKQDRAAVELPLAVLQNSPVTLRNLRVNRPPNTFLIQISYRSPDRDLSSSVANEIANSYIRHTYDLRFQSAEGVSAFMARQLEQLKARMERSSDRLAAFERDLNVADPEQKTAILSSRLIQLNNEYAGAEADRLRKEAAFDSVKGGSLEAAEVSTQGEALKQLNERLSQAREKFASVKAQFGRNFPEYKRASQEVDELQSQVDDARGSISKRVEIEYRQAANREAKLSTEVAGLKKEFDALNARTFEYQTVKRDADADKKLYDELDQKIKEASINSGFQNSSVRLADPARPPLKPISPNARLNLLIAFGFSLCGALIAAVAADRRDATVKDPDTAPDEFLARVAGTLPHVAHTASLAPFLNRVVGPAVPVSQDRLIFDEAVQALLSMILLSPENDNLRSLAVTSSLPGDGKTVIACHLAAANARQKRRTLLIDFDLRRPMVDRFMGLQSVKGMESVLQGEASWRDGRRTEMPFLDILSIGHMDSELAMLSNSKISGIVAEAGQEYGLVIVDSPPILGFSTPLEIAACVDAVLVVAVSGETDSRLFRHCIDRLRQVGADNLSLVLNKVTTAGSAYGYYGKYLKHYRQYRQAG